jgi:hypothetical protein
MILALAGIHVFMLMHLFEFRPARSGRSSRALQVTFIPAPPPITPAVDVPTRTRPERRQQPETSGSAITSVPPSEPPRAPRIDWQAEAQRAAASVSAESSPHRSFGPRERPPPPPKQKPFGWDPTQTQKVEALPEGGMLIRLSDNCALVLAPLPSGGCGIGKRKARGDLFEGMSAPRQAGDWKDDSRLP